MAEAYLYDEVLSWRQIESASVSARNASGYDEQQGPQEADWNKRITVHVAACAEKSSLKPNREWYTYYFIN